MCNCSDSIVVQESMYVNNLFAIIFDASFVSANNIVLCYAISMFSEKELSCRLHVNHSEYQRALDSNQTYNL